MKLHYILLLLTYAAWGQNLTIDQANHLTKLPLKCLQKEYPNKLNQVLNDSTDFGTPAQLHPAFYGCFDWHSAVHGHWSLVFLLEKFPSLDRKDEIIKKLKENITPEKIAIEFAYFNRKTEKSFERTYGWAWLLKLQQALNNSSNAKLKTLAPYLQPLTDLLITRYIEFLPKLLYPVRAGTHQNTAFGLNFAYDYAVDAKHDALKKIIEQTAQRLYLDDKKCPINWEPSGTDFLSPCLEELSLMQRILSKNDFLKWSKVFLPEIFEKDFSWQVAKVSDRTDGHLVHLDGLNFSRAWHLYRLANLLPEQFRHLKPLADQHLAFSMPAIIDGNYEGEHWLASFVLHAFEVK